MITSCGNSNKDTSDIVNENPIIKTSDLELTPFVDDFINLYYFHNNINLDKEIPNIGFSDMNSINYQTIGVTPSFSKDGSKSVGVCLKYPSGLREVVIDESYWNSGISYYRKKSLIFHELGHCLLNKNHNDEKYRGYYKSIMNSYLIRAEHYQRFEDAYDKELFTMDDADLIQEIDSFFNN